MPIKRRSFLKSSAGSLAGMSMLPTPVFQWLGDSSEKDFSALLSKLIPMNDDTVEQLLDLKIDDPASKWNGGYANQYQIPNAHSASAFVVRGCISYNAKSSKYFQSKALKADIESALYCLLEFQHQDGTIDLYSTNFHSTP